MKYEMIPRPWIQKYMDDVKFMAGCKKRSDVIQELLEYWDEYQWNRLPLYVKRDIEKQIHEEWDSCIDKLIKMGLIEEAMSHRREAHAEMMDLMREWYMKNEED